ncbi:hypothetical protein ACFOD4_13930 [Pseudoroseomonas globiformis]|uniref:Uncharacterized protein n=1 Tax=Teichococcus globiformis TaxID=2307229 RepID=A0ABV7G2U3_9PROT
MTDLVPPATAFNETMLDHAAALGRRDGLMGQRRDVLQEGFAADALAETAGVALAGLLGAALRQCYAAGHCHGAEVRRENEARRRRREAPILCLLPGSGLPRPQPFQLLPGAAG